MICQKSNLSGAIFYSAIGLGLCFAPFNVLARTWDFVPAEARNTASPMPVVLDIPQSTLEGGRDPGQAPYFQGGVGGLFGVLVVAAMQSADNSARHQKAVASVAPVKPALQGFDANAVLRSAFGKSLAVLGWARLADATPTAGSSAPDASDPPFFAAARCAYVAPGELDSVYAYCEVNAFEKGPADGKSKLIFSRRIETQVGLAHYGPDIDARKAQWLANSGEPLKHALTLALTGVAELSVKLLGQDQADYDIYRKAAPTYLDTHGGHMIEGAENKISSQENCFNRKNKSAVKVDSNGTLLQEEDGSVYRCTGFSVQ